MEKIIAYLAGRGISEQTTQDSSIGWNGRDIIIPIFNENRNLLSYKFRRSPFSDIGPKYHYHKGSEMALYNVHTMKGKDTVFITEGELDALAMQSRGFTAVSSTSGSGSFKEEWEPIFRGKQVYILYDNDLPGAKGAYNVQRIIPYAKIVWLPEEMRGGGKDITDYLLAHSIEEFQKLASEADTVAIPGEGLPATKKEMEEECRALSAAVSELEREIQKAKYLDKKRRMNRQSALRDICGKRLGHLRKTIERVSKKASAENDREMKSDIRKARMRPMIEYIPFDASGFAICPWHDEKRGSLKYYEKDNHAFCFGGCGQKDAIDACMLFDKLSFPEAVKKLSS